MRRPFRTFKELTPILQSYFHKIEEKGTVPNSVYEARITLTPKPDKYRAKKENKRLVYLMKLDAKIQNKTITN